MSTILLADDSPHAQRMGEHILRAEGFAVTTVGDAAAALATMVQINPHLVIADAFLPGGSGLELYRQMKKLRPYVRMIATAGPVEPLDHEAVKRAGCDAVLRKPFEASEVLALVRPLLEHAIAETARVQSAVEAALREALPTLSRDITEKVLLALKG